MPFGDEPDGQAAETAADPRLSAEIAAVRLLGSREHTRAELTRKLRQRGHEDPVIGAVLDDLAQRGLQSDARYTELYIELRVQKGCGPQRIRAELVERGVAEDMVEDWLDPRDPAWRDRLREVATARFGSHPPEDRKEMARRARFLEYRGFSADHIRRLLLDE